MNMMRKGEADDRAVDRADDGKAKVDVIVELRWLYDG